MVLLDFGFFSMSWGNGQRQPQDQVSITNRFECMSWQVEHTLCSATCTQSCRFNSCVLLLAGLCPTYAKLTIDPCLQPCRYLDRLTGGYKGYRWSVVIDKVNPNALQGRGYSLHVLVNDTACAEPVPMHGSSSSSDIDMQRLRKLRSYCGSNAGFISSHAGMAVDKVRHPI
jgi:hypothetical protein